jgi:uncharacterized sodium:solute symporter family permease YidK
MTSVIWSAILAILLAALLLYALDAIFLSRARARRSGIVLLALVALVLIAWFLAPRIFPASDPPKHDRWLNES